MNKITFKLLNYYKTYNKENNQPYECKPVNHSKVKLNIYFGLPGAGKSTYASFLAVNDMKRGKAVFSNFPITGAFKLDPKEDLGVYDVSNCRILLDEASVEFNNRDYKNFSKRLIKFFKYHRHHEAIVDVFSQAPDDIDITIRRLAYNCYWIRKGLLPWFITITPIKRTLDDKEGELKSAYVISRSIFSRKIVFTPPYWKYFNTLSKEDLPKKYWEKY